MVDRHPPGRQIAEGLTDELDVAGPVHTERAIVVRLHERVRGGESDTKETRRETTRERDETTATVRTIEENER